MPDFFRTGFAPVIRVDEPSVSVIYPGNVYRAARGIAALNPTISLAAVDIAVQPNIGGYMAVTYTLDTLDVPFTIRQKPNFDGQTSFVPCVSWIAADGSLSRYALANKNIGVTQYDLYTTQVIDPATAMIELWATGTETDLVLPDWELTIGLLERPASSAQTAGQVYTTTQCIVQVTADAGFAAYITSCARPNGPIIPIYVEAVAFSVPSGSFSSNFSLTLSCGTPGATIYYTTNGTTPTTSSPVYSAPISITSTQTVKAFAALTGAISSGVTSATYTKTVTPAGWILYGFSLSPVDWANAPGNGASGNTTVAGTYSVTSAAVPGTWYYYIGFEVGLPVPVTFNQPMYTGFPNTDVNGHSFSIGYWTDFGGDLREFHFYRILATFPTPNATLIVT